MTIFNYIILAIIFCITPAGVLWLCRRISFFEKIGPIMILYAIGMVIGNLPFVPSQIKPLQDLLPNIVIPLAIPMMLFGCTFTKKDASLQLKVIVSGFISVCVAVVGGYLLFGRNISEGSQIGGIISGMYTGGTLNAAALQAVFNIESQTYILINSYDIIISFLYFVFLFSFGIRMFRRLFGESRIRHELSERDRVEIENQIAQSKNNPYLVLLTKAGLVQLAKLVGVTIAVVALSAIVGLVMPQGWFMVVFILMLTTLGVLCSFVKGVRELDLSYDIGMYLIYVFSLVIASMADFSSLDLVSGAYQLGFMAFAVFVSLVLHALICRVMRVDADSMVISSVAFINSPPFVPMASAAMRNKKALVTGLGAGIAGYALGNHLGIIMEYLLSLL